MNKIPSAPSPQPSHRQQRLSFSLNQFSRNSCRWSNHA